MTVSRQCHGSVMAVSWQCHGSDMNVHVMARAATKCAPCRRQGPPPRPRPRPPRARSSRRAPLKLEGGDAAEGT